MSAGKPIAAAQTAPVDIREEALVFAGVGQYKHAHVGIIRVDLTGRIVESNTALQAMLGYSADELAQLPFDRLTHLDDRLIDREAFRAMLAGEMDDYEVAKRIVCRDGQALWCRLVCSLIRDTIGKPAFAIISLEDTTDFTEIEQAKSRFLSLLTHELRTPLANIIGWAREALDVPNLAPEALHIILRNAEGQSRVLNNLLEVSRLIHGRFTLRREATDLWKVTEHASRTMRNQIEDRRIRLIEHHPRRALPVFADVKRLHGVICNLLDNAVKFSPNGGTVTLSARLQEPFVRLDVSDTGRGIAPEQLPVLFRPFAETDIYDVTSGLHLGLMLVKSVVELHGGSVAVHSHGPGRGSTFSVILPSG
jgi:PAS domain S-box-containing protein